MTPSTTVLKLDQVKTEMTMMSYEKIVNHPFIMNQFMNSFSDHKEANRLLEKFRADYMVLVSDKDIAKTIANADKYTVVQSLINLYKDNLSINPYDKEACIVNYGGKVVGMAMAKGKIKRMQETGAIKYIELLEVVYDCDKITNVNGKYSFSKELRPKGTPARIGVLMIVMMNDGRQRHKFVTAKDVLLRKEHAPSKAIWAKWEDEMWRKTAINIFEKEIGRTTLLFSEQMEDEPIYESTEDIVHEEIISDEPDQEADVVEADLPESDILGELAEKKDALQKKIISNPGILKADEIDKLNSIWEEIGIEKLDGWIKAIDNRIAKKKEELKKSTGGPAI